MDFYKICTREIEKGPHKGSFELYPDFIVGRSKDLMVRGRSFYAIWDEEQQLWSTDEYDVQRLVDLDLQKYKESLPDNHLYTIKSVSSFNSNSWNQFKKYVNNLSDNSHQLDDNLVFANQEIKKADYVSRRLPYPLLESDISAWNELVSTLYSVEERAKLEWAIGAVVSGDSKKIQKFLVLYGSAGTGKSTILNIIQKLFEGYTTTFEAKALGMNGNAFATEAFKSNPLVALQHDGDLSKIEDNTKLNSIISHEEMTMNEKYKPSYTSRVNALLFMGTNQPVKISDAKSGIIRRLIDVHPTGIRIPANHYNTLMTQIDFELGGIAWHCLNVYRAMGKNYYNAYRPVEMMFQTDLFFNFIEAHFDLFKSQNGVSLKQAYSLYKEYCMDTGIAVNHIQPQYKVREELRNYFDEFKERETIDGETFRSYYKGFIADKFKAPVKADLQTFSLVLDETISLFDQEYANQPAQEATVKELPKHKWINVNTTLGELDTKYTHYVKVPQNHIVIDFDLKNEDGTKSLERNLEAASNWPATYAEISKSENGVHLHYIYTGGNVNELSNVYTDGIEIKVYTGDSALRRKLTKCNSVPINSINSGLPKKEKKMLANATLKSEKSLREMIQRNLRKEIHAGTKPSVDFIAKILDDAYESGMSYDVTDLRSTIIAFANNSSNQAQQAIRTVQTMKFSSVNLDAASANSEDDRIVYFDVEVYPNLFVICWKFEGEASIVTMINPSPNQVEDLFKFKLVGFNNRRYDNHILYAAYMGFDNEALYNLSQKIISNIRSGLFGEAYNLSYADIYDYSSKKQSLKKFEIELGIKHMELDIPWDLPVPDELWPKVVEYCKNDVMATEATAISRKQDFVARQILAELSGLSVNHTTQAHTAKIIFGNDKEAKQQFVYTDLSEEFPDYKFDLGKSTYLGEEVGEGGYVYAEPGIYENVALLDVSSMHPTSIENLNLFGPYTQKFSELKEARMAIKHQNYEKAKTLLNGKLAPYLQSTNDAEALSYALKIVINIVYGLTSAKFDNMFRDHRNKDNIVAKRGALFMIDLKYAVQKEGYIVAHIKTDSIKVPNADPYIIKFIEEFGKRYGYDFEHEATYDKLCLVNEAVYIAKKTDFCNDEYITHWNAVGAQFQQPVVYKTLFTKEPLTFEDYCEARSVFQGAMYLDFNYDQAEALHPGIEGMQFVGKTGQFVPVLSNGGALYRVKEGKTYSVAGTKGYTWVEAEFAKKLKAKEIDLSYSDKLVHEAIQAINKFGSFEDFIS
jgi:energy-coupling factor transporter ATP-binding protein EcfA2/DNA-binding ferritin-like protein (Dps family)